MPTAETEIETLANREYKWGFVTDIEADAAPPGLNEEIIRFISPQEERAAVDAGLAAEGVSPLADDERAARWPMIKYPPIDYQAIDLLLGAQSRSSRALDEVDPELLKTYEKLGMPLHERERCWRERGRGGRCGVRLASPSPRPSRRQLAELGIIFCSFSEAVQKHPELVQKYLGSVVPYSRQLLRDAELRRLHRWLVLSTSPRACAARWN